MRKHIIHAWILSRFLSAFLVKKAKTYCHYRHSTQVFSFLNPGPSATRATNPLIVNMTIPFYSVPKCYEELRMACKNREAGASVRRPCMCLMLLCLVGKDGLWVTTLLWLEGVQINMIKEEIKILVSVSPKLFVMTKQRMRKTSRIGRGQRSPREGMPDWDSDLDDFDLEVKRK